MHCDKDFRHIGMLSFIKIIMFYWIITPFIIKGTNWPLSLAKKRLYRWGNGLYERNILDIIHQLKKEYENLYQYERKGIYQILFKQRRPPYPIHHSVVCMVFGIVRLICFVKWLTNSWLLLKVANDIVYGYFDI